MPFAVVIMAVLIALSTYNDIMSVTGKERQRKQIEYSAIILGAVVMFILLRTVWVAPVDALAKKITNFERTEIYQNPVIK